MTHELYRKHRPKDFDGIIGQPEAVKVLSRFVKDGKVPHAVLFSGPSGTGKTTLARILRKKLGCSSHDYAEVNAADSRGIDSVRDIQNRMVLAPINGKCRVWCIDEAHRLTGDAQSALLKTLEDTPNHVWFILCTTDPHKLLPTIKTRCTEIKLKQMSFREVHILLCNVLASEGIEIGDAEREKIAEIADGSARKALVILNQVIGLDLKDRMDAIQKADTKRQAIELARILIDRDGTWAKCAAILKDLEDDPEQVRRLVLGYAQAVVIGGGPRANRGQLVLDIFKNDFYTSGKPGLVWACREVFADSTK